MEAARQQALGYVRALPASEPRPPFIVVVDVGYCLDLYSNFAGVGDNYVPFPDSQTFRLQLSELAEEPVQQRLRLLFTAPQQLDPSRRAAQVTRQLAGQLAILSTQLEAAGHSSEVVAHFLMRCLFTMFAEDAALIPKDSFSGLLTAYAATEELRQLLPDALESLWHTMDTGGFAPDLRARLRRFNGQLFHEARALLLSEPQLTLLQEAAKADWTQVEPAIFGTLLERALDPGERHRLGAHYTPRRYVERLVVPTVLDPLRQEWAAAQAASARRLDDDNPKEARAELVRFLRRLTSVRILDPACGTGNFLYVTLEHLKRLEGEVLAAINGFGQTGLLDLGEGTTVSPRQLLGLELNPRAAAIADVVLRIGYLQWHLRTHGLTQLAEPLLDSHRNIRQQDAVLQHGTPVPRLDAQGRPVTRWDGLSTRPHPATGKPIPDETAQVPVVDYPDAQPAEWPAADFIVGNPPFLGDKAMRGALGDGYVEALRQAYRGRVPESADLVMYWWDNAARAVQTGLADRFGFITTNSITQTFNRRVIQEHLAAGPQSLSVTFAIPDHPWVEAGNGAAVRVALTVAVAGAGQPGVLAEVVHELTVPGEDAPAVELREVQGIINADLTVGADVAAAQALRANSGISSNGMMLAGSGFIVTATEAAQLGLGTVAGLEQRIRPYRNGKDLTSRPRGVYLLDMFGLTEVQLLADYPELYQWLLERVKPERDHNNRKRLKEVWWQFGETRKGLRAAVHGLPRYIATPETAKHRVFQFLESEVAPDHMLVAIATADAYHLGVLSSRLHTWWAASAGGRMGVGNDLRYNSSRCFQAFPFPTATPSQQDQIRELAEQLDAHRKRQQAQHTSLTLTDLYNVVEKLRAGTALSPKEQLTNQQGLASVLLSLHQRLDAVVVQAYGWAADLSEAELLGKLVQLNQVRAAEEAAGVVQHLRPAYQAPKQLEQQAGLGLTATLANGAATGTAQAWPAELAEQMRAIRMVVQQSEKPLTTGQVAAYFIRTRPEKVRPLLDTLTALALVRPTLEGTYAG
ncbi:Type II restriction/modification system, DNA methylase subunit YeeA [Hymenobacter arizonensis]|uniref:site-specific DNA-methyltransferase (adenine-specific) n=2 Tax=Hymenobacter arizonensis TaxID=1227077 RepID=A0A1I5T9N0_HYMAR|nr:Type II restriction/modification system, DNA methylase subunit YeeA [Hymenobacter arizonensis]